MYAAEAIERVTYSPGTIEDHERRYVAWHGLASHLHDKSCAAANIAAEAVFAEDEEIYLLQAAALVAYLERVNTHPNFLERKLVEIRAYLRASAEANGDIDKVAFDARAARLFNAVLNSRIGRVAKGLQRKLFSAIEIRQGPTHSGGLLSSQSATLLAVPKLAKIETLSHKLQLLELVLEKAESEARTSFDAKLDDLTRQFDVMIDELSKAKKRPAWKKGRPEDKFSGREYFGDRPKDPSSGEREDGEAFYRRVWKADVDAGTATTTDIRRHDRALLTWLSVTKIADGRSVLVSLIPGAKPGRKPSADPVARRRERQAKYMREKRALERHLKN